MPALRTHSFILALSCTLSLAACSGGAQKSDQSAGKTPEKTATPPVNAAPAKTAAPAPVAQTLSRKADGLEFEYRWPAAAAAIPALDTWLRGNGEKLLADNQSEARDAQADAKKSGYTFNGYSYQEDYAVVADTPRILALLSEGYVYTGGAHGMPITTAILWDKGAQKRLGTGALLDIPRLAALARKRFCAELDKQRAEKRGEPVKHDDPNEISEFNSCIDMTKELVLPISKGGKALDMVRVVIAPYDAGPYAEGSYVIDLPLTPALLPAVRPAYRDMFVTTP